MASIDVIRHAWERMQHVYGKRPAQARATAVMRARITEGLRCEMREDGWRFVADMPPEAGGDDAGARPGTFGRAALASCLAMGYAIQLARAGVPWRSIDVEVQADFDNRGVVGMDGVRPGYSEVRHTLYLDCDAPRDVLEPLIDRARRTSPYLDVFGTPQRLVARTVYGRPEA